MQIGDMPLNIAAEVQLIYLPYLHEGRAISHLPYKVVRCNCSSELARDTSGKQAEGLESVGDHQHCCGEIVVAQLVQRACVLSEATEVAATWANVKPVRFLEASFAQRKLEATRASFNSMQPFSSLRTPDDYAKGVLVRKQETKAVILQWQARAISRSLTNLDCYEQTSVPSPRMGTRILRRLRGGPNRPGTSSPFRGIELTCVARRNLRA
eukprot:7385959-Prymnesium_polylepis.1